MGTKCPFLKGTPCIKEQCMLWVKDSCGLIEYRF